MKLEIPLAWYSPDPMHARKSRFEVLNRSFKGIWNLIFSKKGSIWVKTSIWALVWNGPKNALPTRLSGSNSGMGLDTDGLTSYLDLMKIRGGSDLVWGTTVDPIGDPSGLDPSEEPDDVSTSPPCDSSL